MSSNVLISVEQTRLLLTLKSFAPDGPLQFTIIRIIQTNTSLDVEDHCVSLSAGNSCRYSLTKTVPTSEGQYSYLLVADFAVYHDPGIEQTFSFWKTGLRSFVDGLTAGNYAMLGSYAMFLPNVNRGNLTRAAYWSLRKALPYPIVE